MGANKILLSQESINSLFFYSQKLIKGKHFCLQFTYYVLSSEAITAAAAKAFAALIVVSVGDWDLRVDQPE